MTKTEIAENLTDGIYMEPKWKSRSSGRLSERMRRDREAMEARRERDRKIKALKRKWAKKLEDHQGLYNRHGRQLELLMGIGEQPTRNDDWVSGRNVGMMELLEELVKDLSEV